MHGTVSLRRLLLLLQLMPVSSNFVSQSKLIDAEPEAAQSRRLAERESLFDVTDGSVSAQ